MLSRAGWWNLKSQHQSAKSFIIHRWQHWSSKRGDALMGGMEHIILSELNIFRCAVLSPTSAHLHLFLHICTYFMYSILFGVFQIDLTQFVQIFFRQCFCLSWASWDLQNLQIYIYICTVHLHSAHLLSADSHRLSPLGQNPVNLMIDKYVF